MLASTRAGVAATQLVVRESLRFANLDASVRFESAEREPDATYAATEST